MKIDPKQPRTLTIKILKADLKAANAEVSSLMQQISLLKKHQMYNIHTACAVERQKVVKLASVVEMLACLVRDAHIPSTKLRV